jgi:hypothetical protein
VCASGVPAAEPGEQDDMDEDDEGENEEYRQAVAAQAETGEEESPRSQSSSSKDRLGHGQARPRTSRKATADSGDSSVKKQLFGSKVSQPEAQRIVEIAAPVALKDPATFLKDVYAEAFPGTVPAKWNTFIAASRRFFASIEKLASNGKVKDQEVKSSVTSLKKLIKGSSKRVGASWQQGSFLFIFKFVVCLL